MEIPYQNSRGHGLPPPIYVDSPSQGDRYQPSRHRQLNSKFSPTLPPISSSIPSGVDIPGADRFDYHVPPPLPPPRFPMETQHEDAWRSNGSRYGSYPEEMYDDDDGPNYKRRESIATIVANKDEGYSSMSFSSMRSPKDRESLRFVSHDMFQFRPNGNDYDNSLLKKLDSRRVMDNRSPPRRSILSASMQDHPVGPRNHDRLHSQLKPLSLPIQTRMPIIDSPGRLSETPLSAASPRSTPFTYRSASDVAPMDFERSPLPLRTRRTNSGSIPDDVTVASTQGDYDTPMEDADIDPQMRRLDINDPYPYSTGQKRRASSPLGDEPLLHLNTSTEVLRRGASSSSRVSPTPRHPQSAHHGSLSSATSSVGRSGSYTSAISMTASSSATSMSAASPFGRRSPGGLSPGGMSPVAASDLGSPYMTPISAVSPRAASSRIPPHQRNLSESRQHHHHHHHQQQPQLSSPRKVDILPKASSKISGILMCECCPKKPKRFETQEELSAHEAEKQYECSFCGNRFKNKNEMERHQNSLHVRRHSWSCAALQSYDRAFHESTTHPGEADSCGYCGEEFFRSGCSPSGQRQATDQNWDDRIAHLQEVHKFRECNSSKKFFRADHFRQHLKHSHAGTSGKWTNMLEGACMLEEDSSPR